LPRSWEEDRRFEPVSAETCRNENYPSLPEPIDVSSSGGEGGWEDEDDKNGSERGEEDRDQLRESIKAWEHDLTSLVA